VSKKKILGITLGILGVLILVLGGYFSWKAHAIWQNYKNTLTSLEEYSQQALEPQTNSKIGKQLQNQLTTLETQLNNLPILTKFIKTPLEYLHLLNQIFAILNKDQQNIIVLLQNSEELRASGGFMGSYLKITLDNGQIKDFYIEDIYQPQGQIEAFKEAPAGAKEYLSGGEGFKLTDSNWHPDFPQAAQEILTLFSLGEEKDIDHLVAINSQVLEAIFAETGAIYLPEFDLTVNASNFTELARADRDQFFPGSKQKTIFLNSVLDQLKIKIGELSWQQKIKVLKVINHQLAARNILFYSQNEELQQIFSEHNWAGKLKPLNQNYLYLVESNVGINKANKNIHRQVTYNLDQETLQISYQNQNSPDSGLHYVNYQRLIIPPEIKVQSMILDGEAVEKWDEIFIQSSNGETYKQVGVLVVVKTQQESNLKINLEINPYLNWPKLPLFIQKQPGIPSTTYTIVDENKSQSIILEQDNLVNF
jgi:hypothetical protein